MNKLFNFFKKTKEIETPQKIRGLKDFINDYVTYIDNPFMMSMLNRMLDTNQFVKFAIEVYVLSEKEKQQLKDLRPKFEQLSILIQEIKKAV